MSVQNEVLKIRTVDHY